MTPNNQKPQELWKTVKRCQVHAHLWSWNPIRHCMLDTLPLYLLLWWIDPAWPTLLPILWMPTLPFMNGWDILPCFACVFLGQRDIFLAWLEVFSEELVIRVLAGASNLTRSIGGLGHVLGTPCEYLLRARFGSRRPRFRRWCFGLLK